MPRGPSRPPVRAVLFDLDETLLLRAPAWQYTVEQAILSVCGRRVDASPLAGEYHGRPWRHALAILLADGEEMARCEALCRALFARSAMKRLTVFEGMGMALDHLRGAGVEMGAMSREPHPVALKQLQSTGLDRFLSVLSATPSGEGWSAARRAAECLQFLERNGPDCACVSADPHDLGVLRDLGLVPCLAAWVGSPECPAAWPVAHQPSELSALITG